MNWSRAAVLLFLGAGGVPHPHADHDGDVAHVEASHGSHHLIGAAHDPRLPTGTAPVLAAAVRAGPVTAPPGSIGIRRASPDTRVRPHGRDPPSTTRPRAPPPLSA